MGARQNEWARRARKQLEKKHGQRCAKCGKRWGLEFDCIEAQGDWHHKVGFSGRISFYRRQDAVGNLQLLCAACNGHKARKEWRAWYAARSEADRQLRLLLAVEAPF